MCAGLRDAFALGWRLNAILDGKVGADVLHSYTSERKEHAKHYINFSQELGSIICISDPEAAAERDRMMKADLAARNFTPVPTDICQLGPGAWCADTRTRANFLCKAWSRRMASATALIRRSALAGWCWA